MKPATLWQHMAIILVPWSINVIGCSMKKMFSRRVSSFPIKAISQVERIIILKRKKTKISPMKDESSASNTAKYNDLELVDLDLLNEKKLKKIKGGNGDFLERSSKVPGKLSISVGKANRINPHVQYNRKKVNNDLEIFDLDYINERSCIINSVSLKENCKEEEKLFVSKMNAASRFNPNIQKNKNNVEIDNKAKLSDKDNNTDSQLTDEKTTEEKLTDKDVVLKTVVIIHNEENKKENNHGIKLTINIKSLLEDNKSVKKRSISLNFLQGEKEMRRKSSLVFLQETQQILAPHTQLKSPDIPSNLPKFPDKTKNFQPRKICLQPSRANTPISMTIDTGDAKPTPLKSNLIKISIALLVGIPIFALALYTVFINPKNNIIILIHGVIGKIFFQVLPSYWILRDEEKIQFVQRRFNRLRNKQDY